MQKRLPLPTGTVLQGRYRIVQHLGQGGMGAVYEAIDDDINLSFALKETFANDDEMRQAFKREAQLLARMTHEAFPRVSHYFTENNGCFLVMELIRGKDLVDLLNERSEPFEEQQVLNWADQILDALEDLHANGIIHRDIKPSNLKLNSRGRIKLLDFGIAKGASISETAVETTVGSLAAATLQYAPLEQVLRASTDWYEALSVSYPEKTAEILRSGTDVRSDLYALAATVYQLLTKTLPINAPTRALTLWSGQADKLRSAHEINRNVSLEVSRILQNAMEIDRHNRPVSAAEMREMLRSANEIKAKHVGSVIPQIEPFINSSSDSAIRQSSEKLRIDFSAADKIPLNDPPFKAETQKLSISGTTRVIFALIVLGLTTWGVISVLQWSQNIGNQVAVVPSPTPAVTNTKTAASPSLTRIAVNNLNVEIKANTEDVPITAFIDGKAQASVSLKPGESRTFNAAQSFKLQYSKYRVGELQMTINGQPAKVPITSSNPQLRNNIEFEVTPNNLAQFFR